MDNTLHPRRDKAGAARHRKTPHRAGLPAKRFFRRFAGVADVPADDLEILAQRLQAALDLDPASPVPDLQAIVHRELRRRAGGGGS